jgi:methionine synthase II (cobalamin-independent)
MENQLGNPDFTKEMDYAPKQVFKDSKRQYIDLMSGNWAWKQAVDQFIATSY